MGGGRGPLEWPLDEPLEGPLEGALRGDRLTLAEEVVLWLCWLPLVRERELWLCEPSPRPAKKGERGGSEEE
jgi:hypothetical protein